MSFWDNQILHGQELECYNILLSFSIDLNFPKKQTFCKVVVVDDDGDGIGNNVDNLGEAEFTLGQVWTQTSLKIHFPIYPFKTNLKKRLLRSFSS